MHPESSIVVVRSGRDLPAAVRDCLDACKLETLVPRNAVVAVKPNLCTAIPERVEAANTAPELAEAVCERLLARTRHVFLCESDNLRQSADQAFEISGYVGFARRLGLRLVNLSAAPCVGVPCPAGRGLELPWPLLDAEVFITLPVLKTHALTYFTGALKNQWGCVPRYDRILLHKHIDELLVILHRRLAPRLAIMDALVCMEGRGPVNGKPRRLDLVIASTDAVALDATAMRIAGLDPQRAHHVRLAAERGLGRIHADRITIDGAWPQVAPFEPAVMDTALSAMNYLSRYQWFVRCMLERDVVFESGRALVQLLRRTRILAG